MQVWIKDFSLWGFIQQLHTCRKVQNIASNALCFQLSFLFNAMHQKIPYPVDSTVHLTNTSTFSLENDLPIICMPASLNIHEQLKHILQSSVLLSYRMEKDLKKYQLPVFCQHFNCSRVVCAVHHIQLLHLSLPNEIKCC